MQSDESLVRIQRAGRALAHYRENYAGVTGNFVESTHDAFDRQLSVSRGDHEWIGGISLFDETARLLSFSSRFDEDTTVKAVFVENQLSSGPHWTFLAARLMDHETFGNYATWNA